MVKTLRRFNKSPLLPRTSLRLRFEAIESGRVEAEHLFARRAWQRFQIVLDDLQHLRVAAREQANGPVRTEHQAVLTKRFKHDIQVALEVRLLPGVPRRLGDQAGKFAND